MKASDIRILAILALGAVAAGCALPEAPAGEEESAEAASAVQAPWVPGDCLTSASCAIGESCTGIPHDHSTIYGKCRATALLSGEGLSCVAAVPCQPGLACTGLSMGPDGTCAPAWMVADYTNSTTYGTTSNVVAYGLATVPVDIVVTAQLNLSNPSNLTLRLTDPNGALAVVCSPSTLPCSTAGLAAGISVGNSRDDSVNGRWTLQVLGSPSPKIKLWALHLSSRWD